MTQLERENPHATTREKPECRNWRETRAARAPYRKRSHMPQPRSLVLQLRPDAAKK